MAGAHARRAKLGPTGNGRQAPTLNSRTQRSSRPTEERRSGPYLMAPTSWPLSGVRAEINAGNTCSPCVARSHWRQTSDADSSLHERNLLPDRPKNEGLVPAPSEEHPKNEGLVRTPP